MGISRKLIFKFRLKLLNQFSTFLDNLHRQHTAILRHLFIFLNDSVDLGLKQGEVVFDVCPWKEFSSVALVLKLVELFTVAEILYQWVWSRAQELKFKKLTQSILIPSQSCESQFKAEDRKTEQLFSFLLTWEIALWPLT